MSIHSHISDGTGNSTIAQLAQNDNHNDSNISNAQPAAQAAASTEGVQVEDNNHAIEKQE